MKEEIQAALEALNDRKTAIHPGEGACEVGPREVVMLFSGFDLDPNEVLAGQHSAAAQAERLISGEANAPAAVAGLLFTEGMAVGLLIAAERAKAEAA
jgi:hypothetical protein